MQILAHSRSVRISPRKVRLIADTLKNMSAIQALNAMTLLHKRAAMPIAKTLKSAIANGVHNAKATEAELVLKKIEVGEGPALKRFRPSTRGRVHPYKKRTSHITVILEKKD